MLIQHFFTPGLSINTYLIADDKTKQAIIIDPTRDIETYIKYVEKNGYSITDIAETHVHADFISGAKELKERLENKPKVHCSSLGGEKWTPKYADNLVRDQNIIKIGNVLLQALHTPGHTPEHIIWICFDETRSKEIPCLAFTGDLLFVGSVGRPDLLGVEETKKLESQLYHSLFTKLEQLPDFLEIFPSHGAGSLCGKGLSSRYTSTLGYEKRFNPFLNKKPIEKWIEDLHKDIPAAPMNFQRIKKMNIQGPPMTEIQAKPIMIDLRSPDLYAKEHIKDSLNIPLGSSFCNWVSSVIAEESPIILIADSNEKFDEAIKNLRLIGFDHIQKKVLWDENRLKDEYQLEKISYLSVQELADIIKQDVNIYILDVRTPAEWNSGHIKEAKHIELANLRKKINEIPKEASIYAVCGSGYRASIAASLLKKENFSKVANIQGGMTAWIKSKLPITV